MSIDDKNFYLDRIEWEGLQKKHIINEKIHADILGDTANSIEIWRDEDYKIKAKVEGVFENVKDKSFSRGIPGEIVKPQEMTGENYNGLVKFKLKHCHIGSIRSTIISDVKGDMHRKYNAELITYEVERKSDYKPESSWITDWYINSNRMDFFYPRGTTRKLSQTYVRNRDGSEDGIDTFEANEGEQVESVNDHAFIDCGDIKFSINAIPKKYEPNWSEKLGIEYQKKFGDFPSISQRESISEIISFITGRKLIKVGSTSFNSSGCIIEETFISPQGGNIKSLCQKNDFPPIKLGTYDTWYKIESVLKQVVPKYLELKEELKLDDALRRYWISNTLPLGTDLPILASGVEILASAWFKSKKSKVQGVYIPKKEFDELLSKNFEDIEEVLKDIPYNDRIIRRMSNAFQLGVNERLQFFFDEIGLKIGEVEKKAIRERNIMIHSSSTFSDEKVREILTLSQAYKTLFNRILLKLLDYNEAYIDYSVLGFPEKNIDDPSGDF